MGRISGNVKNADAFREDAGVQEQRPEIPGTTAEQLSRNTRKGFEAASGSWKSDTFDVMQGVRGVLIIWVFFDHIWDWSKEYYGNRVAFDTSAFLLVAGFTIYLQTRDAKLIYPTWILSKWFSLIPLYLLGLLIDYPRIFTRSYMNAQKGQGMNVGTKVGLWASLFSGFGYLGTLVLKMEWIDTHVYFGSLLFMLTLVYGGFHCMLFSCNQRLKNIFQGSPWPALVLFCGLLVLYVVMGAASGGIALTLMMGVCIAELRYHIPPKLQAFLGHNVTVDILIGGFVVLITVPIPGMVYFSTYKDGWGNILVSAAMPVLFSIILLSLSCQYFHARRSIFVYWLFGRTVITGLFGKYSYPFYLIHQQIYTTYVPFWTNIGPPVAKVGSDTHPEDFSWILIVLMVSLLLAKTVQNVFQDTCVTNVYLVVNQNLFGGESLFLSRWNNEKNPLMNRFKGWGDDTEDEDIVKDCSPTDNKSKCLQLHAETETPNPESAV